MLWIRLNSRTCISFEIFCSCVMIAKNKRETARNSMVFFWSPCVPYFHLTLVINDFNGVRDGPFRLRWSSRRKNLTHPINWFFRLLAPSSSMGRSLMTWLPYRRPLRVSTTFPFKKNRKNKNLTHPEPKLR